MIYYTKGTFLQVSDASHFKYQETESLRSKITCLRAQPASDQVELPFVYFIVIAFSTLLLPSLTANFVFTQHFKIITLKLSLGENSRTGILTSYLKICYTKT